MQIYIMNYISSKFFHPYISTTYKQKLSTVYTTEYQHQVLQLVNN